MDATPDPFWPTLRENVRRHDLLALAVPPFVLVLLFLLPEPMRRDLAFTYRRPTLLSAYTAHYVHFSVDHLAANLVGYLLLAGTGYVLATLARVRRLFGVASATYLLGFPVALSALNLVVTRDAVGYGFSALNMAFAGLLGLLLTVYGGRRLHGALRVRRAPGVFFAVLAVVALLAVPPRPARLLLAGVAVIAALVYAVPVLSALRSGARSPRPTARAAGWLDVGVLATVVVFGYPFVGFPADLRVGDAVVNTYVHLLGFCLAFIVPYLAVEVGVVDVAHGAESRGPERS